MLHIHRAARQHHQENAQREHLPSSGAAGRYWSGVYLEAAVSARASAELAVSTAATSFVGLAPSLCAPPSFRGGSPQNTPSFSHSEDDTAGFGGSGPGAVCVCPCARRAGVTKIDRAARGHRLRSQINEERRRRRCRSQQIANTPRAVTHTTTDQVCYLEWRNREPGEHGPDGAGLASRTAAPGAGGPAARSPRHCCRGHC